MGIPGFVKIAFVKAYLNKLRQVDHGTTVAGTIASILLASNLIDLNRLLGGGTQVEQAIEVGKLAAILSFWLVMKLIGKPLTTQELLDDAGSLQAKKSERGQVITGQALAIAAAVGVLAIGAYKTGKGVAWVARKIDHGVVRVVKHQSKPTPKAARQEGQR